MKMDFARTCLTLATVIWLAGTMVLCACPLLYLSSSVFAGLAVWRSSERLRTWSWVVFIAAAVMTGIHLAGVIS
ncbi:MAG: hypothetical protein ACXW3Z_14340 [Limisphaerales bacterium]